MTKLQAVLLGIGSWAAGVGMFGAFAFAMSRPPTVHQPPPPARVEVTSAVVPGPRASNIVTMPMIEIIGRRQHPLRFAPEVVEPENAPSSPPMNCGDWHPLQQGGANSSVRECQ